MSNREHAQGNSRGWIANGFTGTQRRRIMATLRCAYRVLGIKRKDIGLGPFGVGGTARVAGLVTGMTLGVLISSASAQGVSTTQLNFKYGSNTFTSSTIKEGFNPAYANDQSAAVYADSLSVGITASVSATSSLAVGDQSQVQAGATGGTAIGASSIVSAQYGSAVGYKATAAGTSAVAMGNGATAGASGTSNDVAIGNGAKATKGSSVALGDTATANGAARAVAVGANSTASGASSVAIGDTATASTTNAVAIGKSATANGGQSVSIGAGNTATGNGAVAIGDPNTASGTGAVAMGNTNNASGQGAVALGNQNTASGQGSVALGNSSTASSAGSIALGDTANANASKGIALGAGATANNAGDVALGAGSVTGSAASPASVTIDGSTYSYAGTTPASVVSVGSSGKERQITNVAAGNLSGTSTDAINGSQLFATNQAVNGVGQRVDQLGYSSAAVLGGNAAYYSSTGKLTTSNVGGTGQSTVDGAISAVASNTSNYLGGGANVATGTAPSYTVQGSTYNNVGDAIGGVDNSLTTLNTNVTNGSIGVVQRSATPDVTVLTASGGTAATPGNAQTLTNLAAGTLSSSSTDAVNGSQLYATNQTVSSNSTAITGLQTDALQWNSTLGAYDASHGSGSAQKITNVADGVATNDAVNLSQLQAAQAAATTHYYSVNDGGTAGSNYNNDGATGVNSVAAGGGATASGIRSTAVGYENVASYVDTTAVGIRNTASGYGATAVGVSNQAIGYRASAFGSINTVTGNGATAMGEGNTASGIGAAAIGAVNVASGERSFSAGYFSHATGDRSVALGFSATASSLYSVAIGGNATATNAGDVALGSGSTTDWPHTGDYVLAGSATTAAATTPSSVVSVGALGAERQIQNVAAGVLSDTSTDAINGSQLYATNTAVTTNAANTSTYLGGGADVANGVAPIYTVQGNSYNNVGDAIGGVDNSLTTLNTNVTNGSIGVVQRSAAPDVTVLTASGGTAATPGNAQTLTNLAAGTLSSSSTDAVNGSQLYATNQNVAGNTTAITALQTDALQWSSTLGAYDASHGSGSAQKITNLAAGTISSSSLDAVNGSQLYALSSSAVTVLGGNATYSTTTGELSMTNIGGTGKDNVNDAISSVAATAAAGWNVTTAATGTGTVSGTTVANVAPGATQTVTAGDNIAITQNGTGFTIATNPDLVSTSITTGNSKLDTNGLAVDDGAGNKTTVATGGVSVTDGTNTTTVAPSAVSVTDGTNTTTVSASGVAIDNGPSMTVAGIDAGSKTVTNVAAGAVNSTSTDAVNGSQLYAVQQMVGAGWNVTTAATGTGTVSGTTVANVGPGATQTVTAGDNIAITQNGTGYTIATNPNLISTSITTGNSKLDTNGLTITGGPSVLATGIDAGNMTITSVAAGTLSATSTDAVNGSQLYSTNQRVTQVENTGVFYDLNSNGTKKNSITLQGGDPNAPVVISNVATGVADNDAVNVKQLKDTSATTLASANTYTDTQTTSAINTAKSYTDQSSAQTLSAANAYTDQKFNMLSSSIGEVQTEARQAAAIGLAAASLRYDDRPGKVSAAVGGGVWRGQGAAAFGLGYTSQNQAMRVNVSATNSGSNWGVAGGMSFTLN